MTPDREFEARLRRELHEAADEIEPRRTLADLRTRIARRLRARRRRLHKAARSVPEPPTELLTALVPVAGRVVRHSRPAAAWPKCPCGRRTDYVWCCWRCMAAEDGGWHLRAYEPGLPWTDVHTWSCDLRQASRDPAWYAGTARTGARR